MCGFVVIVMIVELAACLALAFVHEDVSLFQEMYISISCDPECLEALCFLTIGTVVVLRSKHLFAVCYFELVMAKTRVRSV